LDKISDSPITIPEINEEMSSRNQNIATLMEKDLNIILTNQMPLKNLQECANSIESKLEEQKQVIFENNTQRNSVIMENHKELLEIHNLAEQLIANIITQENWLNKHSNLLLKDSENIFKRQQSNQIKQYEQLKSMFENLTIPLTSIPSMAEDLSNGAKINEKKQMRVPCHKEAY
jgi:hypothetical protein